MKHVFVYGSLMYLPVWQQVVARQYNAQPALLADYQRYCVPGETYPGLKCEAGQSVKGLVWLDVQADDLARLDRFEGAEYERVDVMVALPNHSQGAGLMEAQTYLWKFPNLLEGKVWKAEDFERDGLQRFMSRHVVGWQANGARPDGQGKLVD